MFRLIQCMFFLVFLIISSGVSHPEEMMPLRESPIDLVDHRAPSGKPFSFTITLPKETENEEKSFRVYFTAARNTIETSAHVDKEEAKGNELVYTVKAIVPKYEDIFKKVQREWHEGWWSARRARVNHSPQIRDSRQTRELRNGETNTPPGFHGCFFIPCISRSPPLVPTVSRLLK
jgi:hypothetical protein